METLQLKIYLRYVVADFYFHLIYANLLNIQLEVISREGTFYDARCCTPLLPFLGNSDNNNDGKLFRISLT